MLRWLVLHCLYFYRKFLSPLKPPTCRFYPTCSEYAVQAVKKYGSGKGIYLTFRRLIRCHPLCRGGYDPLP